MLWQIHALALYRSYISEDTRADFKKATFRLASLIRAERGQGVSENKLSIEIVLFYRTERHFLC